MRSTNNTTSVYFYRPKVFKHIEVPVELDMTRVNNIDIRISGSGSGAHETRCLFDIHDVWTKISPQ